MNIRKQIEELLEEEYGAYYDGIVNELLDLYNVSKNTGALHTCECNEPDAVNVKICLECDGVTH